MSEPAVSAEDYDENSVPGLWETARWFMRWLLAICGGPSEIAAVNVLARRERRDILHWLRPVEALVRRLLVAEAARLAADLPADRPGQGESDAPPLPRRRTAVHARHAPAPDPEHPEQWAVRFSLSARDGARPAARRRASRARVRPPAPGRCDNEFETLRRMLERMWKKPPPPPGGDSAPPPWAAEAMPATPRETANLFRALPLARRIEAVRRVLDDREPDVTRLARLLARRRSADIERIRRACRPPPERSPYARNRYGENSLRHASAHALEALAPFDTS